VTHDERRELARQGEERLAAHTRECDDCAAASSSLADVARVLAGYVVAVDAAELSRRVMASLQLELARLASAWFWRRLARVTVAALLPLPAVLFLDAYVLRVFYGWASGILPQALVAYLVVSYAALQLLLVAATYAAIPLVLARDAWARAIARAEALP
jgi:hypothetical protein